MSLMKSKSVDDLSSIPLFASRLPDSMNNTYFAALAGLIDEEEDERTKRQQQQKDARRAAKASQPMEMTSSHGPVRGSRKKKQPSFHPYERDSQPSSSNSSVSDSDARHAGPTAGEAVLAMNMLGI